MEGLFHLEILVGLNLNFYEVVYILNLRPNTRETMVCFFTEGLNGFETNPRLLNNAAFCLVPHTGSHLIVEYRSEHLCAGHINAG